MEAFSQSLAAEVAGFGIKVTIVEPAGFSTDWRGPSAVVADQLPEYERRARLPRARCSPARSPSRATRRPPAPAILELVDADEPPLRVFFGTGTLDMIRAEYEKRIENWERWDHIAVAAQGGVKA